MPIITISTATPSKNEGNAILTPVTFLVTRSGDLNSTSSVQWVAQGSGSSPANIGSDIYSDSHAAAGTVDFAIGESSQTILVEIIADTIAEADEQFSIVLSNPVDATIGVGQATCLILNDDSPPTPATLSIAAIDSDKPEGNGGSGSVTSFTFRVTRTGDLSQSSSASWQILSPENNSNVTARSEDFSTSFGSVNFAIGESEKTITIEVKDDRFQERDETFILRLSGPTGATIQTADAVGVIRNDDHAFKLSPSEVIKNEGNSGFTSFFYTVSRDSNLNSTASVDWFVQESGAKFGTDIQVGINNLFGTVNFAVGESSKTIEIKIIGDTVPEPDEQFSVRLTNPVNGVLDNFYAPTYASGTITNDDAFASSFSISPDDATKYEGNSGSTPFIFKITREGDLSDASSVYWSLDNQVPDVDGKANFYDMAGFTTGISGDVTFSPGQSSALITMNIAGDTNIEPDENFTVSLSNPIGASVSGKTATGRILNDDGIASISISPSTISKSEGNSGETLYEFVVTRTGPLVNTSSVNWTLSGNGNSPASISSDFNSLTNGSLSFAAGESSKTIEIKVKADTNFEPNEEFAITLSNFVGAVSGNTVTLGVIQNDDPLLPADLSIALLDATKTEGNEGVNTFTFVVTRTGDTSKTSSVNWKLSNDDAQANQIVSANDLENGEAGMSGFINFIPEQTTAFITINVKGDLDFEKDESLRVQLFSPFNATISKALAIGLVKNDDIPMPTATIAIQSEAFIKYEGNNGANEFSLTVTRSGDLQQESQASWSVVGSGAQKASASDFIIGTSTAETFPSGTVKFAVGQSTAKITLSVKADVVKEFNESFDFILSNPTGAGLGKAITTVTIANDDYQGTIKLNGESLVSKELTIDSSIQFDQSLSFMGFEWQADGKKIVGATGETLNITVDLIGKSITAIANYIGAAGPISISSQASPAVINLNHKPIGSVSIVGNLKMGSTIVAQNNLSDQDGLGTISYQWRADSNNIPNASSDKLIIDDSLIGKSISVVASYTDKLGTKESIASTPTTKVQGVFEGTEKNDVLNGSNSNDIMIGKSGDD